jgi:hypothetical protein
VRFVRVSRRRGRDGRGVILSAAIDHHDLPVLGDPIQKPKINPKKPRTLVVERTIFAGTAHEPRPLA